ncbi:DUF1152 domain-containing protein [Janibacter cremeus]|uniref:DUF1152 domain-containing protein n=1 Tax=Janibacter cremeus TaxID=1285192 RepID=A0A852VUE4_9MICO|nr:DUF1152 domain-containing protein [Janibacter cremeus]NYF97884.1 hypothetical protein [Janibacter cremeus]
MRTLYVAAGGGGDAVGALLARRALGDTDERPALVSTCAWERLRIDPIPGPRARADFTGLALVNGEPAEITPRADTVPPGRSVLPRLAETSGARIFLHDLDSGAVGLRDQLRRLSSSLDVDKIVLIDVGGDIVARGRESGLRSPLADSLTLAATLGTGIPTSVVVLGPGADAELPEGEVLELLKDIEAEVVGHVSSDDVRSLAPVLSWHPTEATALVAAGAGGMRGSVAMRRGRDPVPVTNRTPEVWVVSHPAFESFPLAQLLQGTTILSEAEEVMRTAAIDEIDFERRVAAEASSHRRRMPLPDVMFEMEAVGATHITGRRVSEILSLGQGDEVPSITAGGLWSRGDLMRLAESTKH